MRLDTKQTTIDTLTISAEVPGSYFTRMLSDSQWDNFMSQLDSLRTTGRLVTLAEYLWPLWILDKSAAGEYIRQHGLVTVLSDKLKENLSADLELEDIYVAHDIMDLAVCLNVNAGISVVDLGLDAMADILEKVLLADFNTSYVSEEWDSVLAALRQLCNLKILYPQGNLFNIGFDITVLKLIDKVIEEGNIFNILSLMAHLKLLDLSSGFDYMCEKISLDTDPIRMVQQHGIPLTEMPMTKVVMSLAANMRIIYDPQVRITDEGVSFAEESLRDEPTIELPQQLSY